MEEERGLVGLGARGLDGEELGRISEVVTDERTGEVTHVVVEMDEDRRMEIPITDLAAAPEDTEDAQTREELDREADEAGGWADEASTPFDSGYPRNDAYIDPDSGQERERYPQQGEDLRSDVEQLLDGTELRVREVREGVVELEGAASREDLVELVAEIMDLDEVLDVDT